MHPLSSRSFTHPWVCFVECQRFQRKSEKLEQQIEQLELRLEDLQQAEAAEQLAMVQPSGLRRPN